MKNKALLFKLFSAVVALFLAAGCNGDNDNPPPPNNNQNDVNDQDMNPADDINQNDDVDNDKDNDGIPDNRDDDLNDNQNINSRRETTRTTDRATMSAIRFRTAKTQLKTRGMRTTKTIKTNNEKRLPARAAFLNWGNLVLISARYVFIYSL